MLSDIDWFDAFKIGLELNIVKNSVIVRDRKKEEEREREREGKRGYLRQS